MPEITPVASPGYMPQSAPDAGEDYISTPRLRAPGETFISDPRVRAPGEEFISDLRVRPPEGFISDHRVRPPEGFISDPRVRPPEGFISDERVRPPEGFISDHRVRPPEGFISEQSDADKVSSGTSGSGRNRFSTTDHFLSAASNLGNFFEDVWENRYGEATQDAGQVLMDTGSALYKAIFGDGHPTST